MNKFRLRCPVCLKPIKKEILDEDKDGTVIHTERTECGEHYQKIFQTVDAEEFSRIYAVEEIKKESVKCSRCQH